MSGTSLSGANRIAMSCLSVKSPMRPRRSAGNKRSSRVRSSRRMIRSCARSGMNRDQEMPIANATATSTAQALMNRGSRQN